MAKYKTYFFFWVLFLVGYESGAQCDIDVGGIYYFCDPATPGQFYVGFYATGDGGDFNVVDTFSNLTNNGYATTNLGSLPRTSFSTGLTLNSPDTTVIQFGPINNGTDFYIELQKVGDPACKIFVEEGNYTCSDVTPSICASITPFYEIEFNDANSGNVYILTHKRDEECCGEGGNFNGIEFKISLDPSVEGIQFIGDGAGAFGTALVYKGEFNGSPPDDACSNQIAGVGITQPLCLESAVNTVVYTKPGGDANSFIISPIPGLVVPELTLLQNCADTIFVEGASSIMWEGITTGPGIPYDTFLVNLDCGSGPGTSISCTDPAFVYNTNVFADVTDCNGLLFQYKITGTTTSACGSIELVDTVEVLVLPNFNVRIDTICNNPDDPNEISFVPIVEGDGALCDYYEFEWVTSNFVGDTLVVSNPTGFTEMLVTRISTLDLEMTCWDTITFEVPNGAFSIECPGDALYSCLGEVPVANIDDVTVNTVCDQVPTITFSESMTGSGCINDTLVITRTYIADRDGNTANTGDQISCDQVFKVVDEDGPSLSCPSKIEIMCATDIPNIYVDYLAFEAAGGDASDVCGLDTSSFAWIEDVGTIEMCPDTITRFYRIADNCSNYDTCFQYIIYNDLTAPTIIAPRDTIADGCDTLALAGITTLAYSTTAVEILETDYEGLDSQSDADDNCGVETITYVDMITQMSCPLIVERTFTAIDSCGGMMTDVQTIMVQDTMVPVLSGVPDSLEMCYSEINPPFADLEAFLAAGGKAMDNCLLDTMSFMLQSESYSGTSCPDTLTRIYVIADNCTNQDTAVHLIIINDETNPTIVAPRDTIADGCDTLALAGITTLAYSTTVVEILETDYEGLDSQSDADDNCGVEMITYIDVIIQLSCPLIVERTFTAIDSCGGMMTDVQTIMVQDTMVPVLSGPPDSLEMCYAEINPPFADLESFLAAGGQAMDNCLLDTMSFMLQSESYSGTSCPDTLTRIYVIADNCTNQDTAVHLIIINDETNPTIVAPRDTIADGCDTLALAGITTLAYSTTAVEILETDYEGLDSQSDADDNCGVETITYVDMITQMSCPLIVERTFTAIDSCGGMMTDVQTIMVQDTMVPVLSGVPDSLEMCYSEINPPFADLEAFLAAGGKAMDNCLLDTMSFMLQSESYSGTSCPDTLTRIYVIADNCTNQDTAVHLIIINDETNPTIVAPRDTIADGCDTLALAGITTLAYSTTVVEILETDYEGLDSQSDADDNCGVEMITYIDVIIQLSCPLIVERTFTAIDSCGGMMTDVQTIMVQDTMVPVLSGPPDSLEMCYAEINPPFADLESFLAAGGQAMDNCLLDTMSFMLQSESYSGTSCPDTLTRIYVIADNCTNQDTAVHLIIINDETNPTIVAPRDTIADGCDTLALAGITTLAYSTTVVEILETDYEGLDSQSDADDNCGVETITYVDMITQMSCPLIVERTFTAIDSCGGMMTDVQTIMVQDTMVPTLVGPPDSLEMCYAEINPPFADLESFLAAGGQAMDNCLLETMSFMLQSESYSGTSCPDTLTRIYVIADNCTNQDTAVHLIIINDETNPTIVAPRDTIADGCDTLALAGITTLVYSTTVVEILETDYEGLDSQSDADDNCGVETITYVDMIIQMSCPLIVERTFTAIDSCGGMMTDVQTIMVQDTMVPTLVCPATASGLGVDETAVEEITGLVYSSELVTIDTMTFRIEIGTTLIDDCGIDTIRYQDEIIQTNCPFIVDRTFTAIDSCGNRTMCTQRILINDDEPPTIICPRDTIGDGCDTLVVASITGLEFSSDTSFIGEMAFDDLDDVSEAMDVGGLEDVHYYDVITQISCPIIIHRTFTAVDSCGLEARCIQTIMVQDTMVPVLSGVPDSLEMCYSEINPPFADLESFLAAGGQAMDNCLLDTMSFMLQSESYSGNSCPDTLTRIYVIADNCTNQDTAVHLIIINDETNPTIVAPRDTIADGCDTLALAGITTLAYSTTAVEILETDYEGLDSQSDADDNCGVETITYVDMITQMSCPLIVERTFTAIDSCGGMMTDVQTIMVQDTMVPTLVCPATASGLGVDETAVEGITGLVYSSELVTIDTMTFRIEIGTTLIDDCGIDTIRYQDEIIQTNCPFIVDRTFTAIDSCGNRIMCTQRILINDDEPPTIICPRDTIGDGCDTLVVASITGLEFSSDTSFIGEMAFDDLDDVSEAMDVGGLEDVHYYDVITQISCPIIIHRLFTAVDSCGLEARCIQTIMVQDTMVPVLSGVPDSLKMCYSEINPPFADLEAFLSAGGQAMDNCLLDTMSFMLQSESYSGTSCPDTLTRIYVIADNCTNQDTAVHLIIINDETNPTIVAPRDTIADGCDTLALAGITTLAYSTTVEEILETDYEGLDSQSDADDNCGVETITYVDMITQMSCPLIVERTFTAIDSCGGMMTDVQTIMVQDTMVPVLSGVPDSLEMCYSEINPPFADLESFLAAGGQAMDNCLLDTMSFMLQSESYSGTSCPDTLTRIYVIADNCTNQDTAVHLIIINDETNPTIVAPRDTIADGCDTLALAGITTLAFSTTVVEILETDYEGLDSQSDADDNCGVETITYVDMITQMSCPLIVERTFTAIDSCGGMMTDVQTIMVQDTMVPVLSGVPDSLEMCYSEINPPFADLESFLAAGGQAMDNCLLDTMSFMLQSESYSGTSCPDTLTRIYVIADNCTNQDTAVHLIIINDETNPTIVAPRDTIADGCDTLALAGITTLAYSTTVVEILETDYEGLDSQSDADDNCGVETITYIDVITQMSCPLIVERTFTAIDSCGRMMNDVQTIMVQDTMVPTLVGPPDSLEMCYSEINPPFADLQAFLAAGGQAMDNCLLDTMSFMLQSESYSGTNCPDTLTRIYVIADNCNNQDTAVHLIIINDETNPIPPPSPQYMELQCEEDLEEPPGSLFANDNCSGVIEGVYQRMDNGGSGLIGDTLIIERTWTFTDDCGNDTMVFQIIKIVDDMPPMEPPVPPDTIVSCLDDVPVPVDLTASFGCGETETVSPIESDNNGNGCIGDSLIIIRTWTFAEGQENELIVSQLIYVVDSLPPVVPILQDTLRFVCLDELPPLMSLSATDNCNGPIEVNEIRTSNNGAGCINDTLKYERKWVFEDLCGNKDSVVQIMIFVDDVPPTATFPPDIAIPCEADSSDLNITGMVTEISDNCTDTEIVPVYTDSIIMDGGFVALILRRWEIADDCNNITRDTQEITFIDLEAPALIFCPRDTMFQLEPGQCEIAYTFLEPVFTDNCNFIVERTDNTDVENGGLFYTGSNIIEYTALDQGGNTTVCRFEVFVQDFTPGDFACKGEVQISLGQDCEYVVSANDLLAGGPYGCIDNYVVVVGEGTPDKYTPIPTSPIVTKNEIGKKIIYTITDPLSGLTCWGYITIEDKLGPLIIGSSYTALCTDNISPDSIGFPFDKSDILERISETVFLVDNLDNCFLAEAFYTDSATVFDCTEDVLKIIYRKWGALDELGNKASGFDTIIIEKLELIDVLPPPNFDDIDLPSLSCDSARIDGFAGSSLLGWNTLPNGNPSPDNILGPNGEVIWKGTGYPTGQFCDNVFMDFKDKRLELCDDNSGSCVEIIRDWVVMDLCTNDRYEFQQIIKIKDKEGPKIIIPFDTIKVNAGIHECTGEILIDFVTTTDNCSNDISLSILPSDSFVVVDEIGPVFKLMHIALGYQKVYFSASDCCGNTTIDSLILDVKDDRKPFAVAKEFSTVSLSYNKEMVFLDSITGIAKVWASSIDNGSFDNCNPVWLKVLRQDTSACQYGDYDRFNDFVPVCCEDTEENRIKVLLRVYDRDPGLGPVDDQRHLENGDLFNRFSDTWGYIKVEDKLPPILKAPDDVTVSCQYDYELDKLDKYFGRVLINEVPDSFSGFDIYCPDDDEFDIAQFNIRFNQYLGANGYVIDPCGVEVVQDYTAKIDCSEGQIVREFVATDRFGNTSKDYQYITIENCSPFYISDTDCENKDTLDGVIWPCDYQVEGCSVSLDPVITGRPVINEIFCQDVSIEYEDILFENGSLTGCYKIKRKWKIVTGCHNANNQFYWEYYQLLKVTNSIAPFISKCDTLNICILDDCSSLVELSIRAADDCTPSSNLLYEYGIDLDGDGVNDIEGTGNNSTIELEVGIYTVLWKVSDRCGNVTYCEQAVVLKDCKAPVAYCVNNLSTTLSERQDTLTIWATDFDRGSYDNCSDSLHFSFSENPNDTFYQITCLDFEGQLNVNIDLELYVWDTSGNYDKCFTNLSVRRNDAPCEGSTFTLDLFGQLFHTNGEKIQEVSAHLYSDGLELVEKEVHPEDGYIFNELSPNFNYGIHFIKEDDILREVNTLDIVKLQQHILGINEIENKYLVKAGDINNDGVLTAVDVLYIRKVLLGLETTFKENEIWRFISSNYELEPEKVMNAPIIDYHLYTQDAYENYIGIKTGDVDGGAVNLYNRNSVATRNNILISLNTTDLYLEKNERYSFNIYLSSDEIAGLQFVMQMSNDVSYFNVVSNSESKIRSGHVNVVNDLLYCSFDKYSENKIDDNVLIEMQIEVKNPGRLSTFIELVDRPLQSEGYINGLSIPLQLQFEEPIAGIKIKSIAPNPFSDYTIVKVESDQAFSDDISIVDLYGRRIRKWTSSFVKGETMLRVEKDNLRSGVYYMKFENHPELMSKIMVIK